MPAFRLMFVLCVCIVVLPVLYAFDALGAEDVAQRGMEMLDGLFDWA